MKSKFIIILLPLLIAAGCSARRHSSAVSPFSQYHAANFEWRSVRRVLIMPLVNQSTQPSAAEELRTALAAELQSTGQYEVILASPETSTDGSQIVRVNGRFDEVQLVEIAQKYQADGVLFGALTQYQPYAPPRIGLSLRLISSLEGVVIASVDGFWDARNQAVADEARRYCSRSLAPSPTLLASDVVLSSPQLFQRFVSHQVAHVFATRNSSTGAIDPADRQLIRSVP